MNKLRQTSLNYRAFKRYCTDFARDPMNSVTDVLLYQWNKFYNLFVKACGTEKIV